MTASVAVALLTTAWCAGCAAAGITPSHPGPSARPAAPAGCPPRAVATPAARGWPAARQALAQGRWSTLARSPLGPRYGPSVLWDGRDLLEIGGTPGGRLGGGPPGPGAAAYDPASRRWRRLASVPAAAAPAYGASVWTGRQAFVFGQAATNIAGVYDPATDEWTTTRAPLDPLNQPTAVWTGRQVVLAGLAAPNDGRLEAAAYDPAKNTWLRLDPPVSPRHPPMALAMVATNDGVVLWSLWGRTRKTTPRSFRILSGVDVYRWLGAATRWQNATGRWPQRHTVDQPTFTGKRILLAPGQIWCGACSHPAPFGEHGYSVDPQTLHRAPIPKGPFDDLGPQILWTGAAEISLDAGGALIGQHVRVLPGDIAFWNPVTRRWARGHRAPRPLSDAPAVWAGNGLFVLARDGRLLRYAAG